MKRIVLAALLAAGAATAEDGYLKGEALQAGLAKCAEGCIVLSRQDVAELQRQIYTMAQQVAAEAHRAGTLSCRNAI
jgi:hypothetical protein